MRTHRHAAFSLFSPIHRQIRGQPSAAAQPKTIGLKIRAAALVWLIAVLPSFTAEAQLLFKSGFTVNPLDPQTSVILEAPNECDGSCWQTISGKDSGYTWPPRIWHGESSSRLHLLADVNLTGTTTGQYFTNRVHTVKDRNGIDTQALRLRIEKSGCCGTGPQGGGSTQTPFEIHPAPGVTQGDLYISYWMKFQSNLKTLMQEKLTDILNPNPTGEHWRAVFEWKTAEDDYRLALYVNTSLGGCKKNEVSTNGSRDLFWRVEGDKGDGGGGYNNEWGIDACGENKKVPVPVDAWFKLEIFWHRGSGDTGRVWMAVTDPAVSPTAQVIADRRGNNMGPKSAKIDRIMVNQLYTSTTYPVYQWIDDLEIWSSFPHAWLPAVLQLLLDE